MAKQARKTKKNQELGKSEEEEDSGEEEDEYEEFGDGDDEEQGGVAMRAVDGMTAPAPMTMDERSKSSFSQANPIQEKDEREDKHRAAQKKKKIKQHAMEEQVELEFLGMDEPIDPDEDPENWEVYKTPEGKPYFFNKGIWKSR